MKPTQRIRINHMIQALELRVVDAEGELLGVMSRNDALARAEEIGLDLIEISPNAQPPVAKIMDFGKYQYELKKKERGAQSKSHASETKTVQIKIGTGEHDLELKAKKASEWLGEGHRIRCDLYLRGRAQYLDKKFLEERIERFLRLVSIPFKIADPLKKSPKGMSLVIERA